MALTIPNESAAPANAAQSTIYQADIDAMVAGAGGTGVLYGCAVTAQGSPNNTVAVEAGAVMVGGVLASVTAGNVTMPTADGTHPMWVLISVNSSGTKAATAGTAAASPLLPAIPASSVALAAVWWPASDTTVASTQITDKRAVIPPMWEMGPWDHGLLAWTYDIAHAVNSGALTSGNVTLAKIRVPFAITATYIWLAIGTAGSGLTSGQNFVGLYDTGGSRLGVSADQSASWASNGNKQIALTSPVSLAAGYYHVAILSVGSTPIAPRRCIVNTDPAALNLSGASLRWASGPGGQTSLPSSITMSSNSSTSNTFWAGVS